MHIRTATMADLENIAAVEAQCFPAAEAASKASFQERLTYYPNHFWLLEEGRELMGFVNGLVTDQAHLTDEMFARASLHDEHGAWQMIFGVNTMPAYRRRGYAGKILQQVIADAKQQQRQGLVLTCKDRLVHYYAKFGFVDEGICDSTHGGAVWHEMRLVL
jgi:ribosomal protein S18 acetylase RimI-like enzyme